MAGLKKQKLAASYYEKFLLFGGMEYYSLKEDGAEGLFTGLLDKAVKGLLDGQTEGLTEELSAAREELLERMDILTSYVDTLSVYQYALNRVELRFAKEPEVIEEEVFVQKVMQYIFSSKDNMVINEQIKEIIGQLPVRMTKGKYFERLANSLSIYKGADKSSLDSMLYVLRTSAMLYHPKKEGQYYKEYEAVLDEMKKTNFRAITKEEHQRLEGILDQAGGNLMKEMDCCMLFAEAVNHFYGAFLVKDMAEIEIEAGILSLLEASLTGDFTKAGKELEKLEGRQERLLEGEAALEKGLFEADRAEAGIRELTMAQALGSDSLFMEFHWEEEEMTVDQKMVSAAAEQLTGELKELFSQNSMLINRAVMANTLSKLPVFFETSQEVMDYIKDSLEQCHDVAEKTMSMKLIYRMMEG